MSRSLALPGVMMLGVMLRRTLVPAAAMLLSMATCSLDADTVFQVRVAGRAIDSYHSPIQNALVAVTYGGNTSTFAETRTASDGTFTIELPTVQGACLRIASPGFKERRVAVSVSQSNGIDLGDITLEIITVGGPDVEVVAQAYTGRYSDQSYGFSVDIPEGFKGWTFGANTPNLNDARGISIKAASQSIVFVEAAYESLGGSAHITANTRMGGLHANEANWKESGGAAVSHKALVARRRHHNKTVRYKIQVDYGPDEEAAALRVFNKVMKSFRTIRIAE